MDMILGQPENTQLLWIVAGVCGVLVVGAVIRRQALARFATANLFGALLPHRGRLRVVAHPLLVVAGLGALTVALVDPRWGRAWREVPQKGIEMIFLLDVSRSMLAQDTKPNRLERAKQQIRDMLDQAGGDRVGLVVFAGEAQQKIPLTSNYNEFKLTLEQLGPQSVKRGGSRLGDAIRIAANGFLDKTTDHKALIVVTDGEDHQSQPVEAARTVFQDKGIRVVTLGLGDMDQGARIPLKASAAGRLYLQHQGQQVWSKMNGTVLKETALAGNGAYIPAGTKLVDMAKVYRNYIATMEQADFETARINSYIPRFQWFAGIALVLILLDTFWGDPRSG